MLNIPAQRNRPPRIMEELPILPDSRVTVVPPGAGDCPELRFGFTAEDPDVNDLLTVRWYVDYHRPYDLFIQDNEQTLTPSPSGNPVREDRGSLNVRLNSALQLPASQLQQPGTHVVEALLFDFRLGPARNPLPITPATDGGIENPSYAVSYAWVVEVQRNCP